MIENLPCFCFYQSSLLISQLEHAPRSQFFWRLSVNNVMLCKAQHVFQISSHLSMLLALTPHRKTQKRTFRIPKVHSTSFLIDSSHSENRMYSHVTECFIFGTSVDRAKYPLSTMNHAPWCYCSKTSPAESFSKRVNLQSLDNVPSCTPLIN